MGVDGKDSIRKMAEVYEAITLAYDELPGSYTDREAIAGTLLAIFKKDQASGSSVYGTYEKILAIASEIMSSQSQ